MLQDLPVSRIDSGHMQAAVNTRYGTADAVSIRYIETPQPRSDELLVEVHATTVTRTDSCALRAHPWFMRATTGFLRPRRQVLGLDYAGVVSATGSAVAGFAVGDRVFGLTPNGYGAHAQFVCVPSQGMVCTMPAGKAFHEVVVGEGAWYANTYLRRFAPAPGQSLLIYGASGAIGSAAVQLAKARGVEVTAVTSTAHVELVASLGADRVVDYTAEDFTAIGKQFDFVLDAVGKTTYSHCLPLLKPNGVFSATDLGPWWQNLLLGFWYGVCGNGRVVMPMPRSDPELMKFLKSCLESGTFRAVIDRHYPLARIDEAYRYVASEKKVGIVVVDVEPD